MLNVFTLANGRLFQEEIESQAALAARAAGLGRPRRAHRRGKGLDRRALRPDDPERRRRRRPRGVGPLLRGRQRRAAHPLRLPDRRRRDRRATCASPSSCTDNVLFSVHAEDLPVFRLLRLRARRIPALIEDAKDVLLKLYDADAEYSADALEGIYDGLEAVSARVLRAGRQRPGRRRGAGGDRAPGRPERPHPPQRDGHAPRGQLHDAQPACSTPSSSRRRGRSCATSTRSTATRAFLFDKINFLMDATVGFININQNKIIKIFSVASVALLPPTLIASIYGMNFRAMPELDWQLGYPFALALMVAVGRGAVHLLPPQGLAALGGARAGVRPGAEEECRRAPPGERGRRREEKNPPRISAGRGRPAPATETGSIAPPGRPGGRGHRSSMTPISGREFRSVCGEVRQTRPADRPRLGAAPSD